MFWGGEISRPSNDQRKVRTEAAYLDHYHISFSCEIPRSQQLYAALRPFLPYPTVKKDIWTHKRESKARVRRNESLPSTHVLAIKRYTYRAPLPL